MGKIVYFLFVWLVGIGFRQNFFRVLPNFGDFGAKMSFFHYIFNQKRNNFIKHCSPPPCTKKPLISEMYIYIKSSLCKWGLGTRGGTMFYRQKTKGVSAYNTQNTLYPMENYVNCQLSDKNMKFGIMVVHDLTNDISYNSKLNWSKICYFGVK